jgi:hypothetical protein
MTKRAYLNRKQLERLINGLSKVARQGDEWLPPTRWPALQVVPARRSPSRVLYLTKMDALLGIDLEKIANERDAIAVLFRYGLPGPEHAACVLRECERHEVSFVGDLDPLDLTVFLSLASYLGPKGIQVRFLGVNSEWISLCRRHLKARNAWQQGLPVIAMSVFEKEHYARLKDLPVPWVALLGQEAIELLNCGHKLELEGATNPALYATRHKLELKKLVFGK